jgi:hypothetical protein
MGSESDNPRRRRAAVAGLFYPSDPQALHSQVEALLSHAAAQQTTPSPPDKALIVPHAGYAYSGIVAAAAFARLLPRRTAISRVVLVGPSHRARFRGLALPEAACFATPLGDVPIDPDGRARLLALGDVIESDAAHAQEHCLEVQLPFLQRTLESFSLLPLLTGEARPEQVARALATVWGGPETLIVVSSDLSHYLSYAQAQRVDARSAEVIAARSPELESEQACGALAINGLLTRARALDLRVEPVARLNSGDTSGDRQRVVGYGAWGFHAA